MNPLMIFPAAMGSQNPSKNAPRIVRRAKRVLRDTEEGVQAE